MKIAVMVGSLRKESYHRKLFELYAQLADSKFTFDEVKTDEFPLYNSDLEASKPESINQYADTIRAADGVLFFSPEYNYSVPGHLKNAIDWLSRVDPQPFNNKKASIIGGSPGVVGTARMQYELRKIGVFLNIQFMNKPEVMISSMYDKFNDNMELIDQGTISFLQKHADVFKHFIAEA